MEFLIFDISVWQLFPFLMEAGLENFYPYTCSAATISQFEYFFWEIKMSKFSDSSILCENFLVSFLLYDSKLIMFVLYCGQNKTFEDVVLVFGINIDQHCLPFSDILVT